MPAIGYKLLTVKEKSANIFKDLSFTLDNNHSKQLAEVCQFFIDHNDIKLKHRSKKGDSKN